MLLSLVLLCSGCGISQSEYDTLLAENETLQQEVESLSTQIDALSSENDALSSQVTTLSSENDSLSTQVKSLSDYKANQVLNSMDKSYGKAWATTAFGDNSLCFSDDDNLYFQCISNKTYSISNEGIAELWSDLMESAVSLGVMLSRYPDKIDYSTISIKFYDPSNIYILDVTLKQEGNSYLLDSIVCNALYADQIIPVIISATNN